MKNRSNPFLAITMLFTGLLIGFFIGRNHTQTVVSISVPPHMLEAPTLPPETEPDDAVVFPIDINKATREEFMALPRIGEILTGRILAYRRERGRFFSVYDLYQVEGMTESIFEEIEPFIFVGG